MAVRQRHTRGIAGSLIWINFDRHALLNVFKKAKGKFVADKDEIRPQYQDSTVDGSAVFTSSITRNLGPQFGVGSTIDALDTIEVNSVGALNELATPWYSDQILPFDVTLAGANEYGAMAAAKIFGLETRSLHPAQQQTPRARAKRRLAPVEARVAGVSDGNATTSGRQGLS